MTTVEILAVLQNVRGRSPNWTARCPSHDDRENSLSVSIGRDDRTILKCHASASCTAETIVSALGLTMADLFFDKPVAAAQPKRTIDKVYDYTDAEGNLLHQTVRFKPKSFTQRRPCPVCQNKGCPPEVANREPDERKRCKQGWLWTFQATACAPALEPPALYRLPYLVMAEQGEQVFICSGEKDADRLGDEGLMATTNPMGEGSGKWRASYNQHLQGMNVVLLEDNDPTGHAHCPEIASQLQGIAASVKIIGFRDMAEHSDVSDWLNTGHTKDELLALVEATPEWRPSASIIEFPDQPNQPEFRRLSVNAWEYRPRSLGALRLTARRVTTHRDEISAWFEGAWDTPGAGTLFHDHVNFGSSTMPKTVATNARRYDSLSVEELQVHIREFKRQIIDASFTAAQVTDLGDPAEDHYQHALVEGLIPGGVPVWIYGARGSAKTLLDLYLLTCTYYGLPFLGFPTTKAKGLLCEFEETARDVKPVLARIAKGLNVEVPHIPHLWCAGGSLRHQIDQLSAARDEFDAGYVVVDSVLAAVGASSDYVSNADGITMLIEAVNSLGNDVGSILNDHINQADLKAGGDADPRDSGRKLDAARVAYQVQRLAKEPGSMRLKIRQAKPPMNAPPMEPFGVLIRWFQDGAITFDRTDDLTPAQAETPNANSVRQAMVDAILASPNQQATPAELAAFVHTTVGTVKARLSDTIEPDHQRTFEPVGDGYWRITPAVTARLVTDAGYRQVAS